MSSKKALWLPGMNEENLIVPEDISDFLDIQVPVDSAESEFDKMILVNDSGRKFLEGSLDIGSYLDILEYAGIDPCFHLQEAAWQCANLLNY